ncbi:unnamed protein product [Rotaria sp. Silwood1]|nr:unnamed protein product [Rotaria sp. Silwood1]
MTKNILSDDILYRLKYCQKKHVSSRKSLSGNWKTNIGSSIIQQIEMTDRYRLWIDEVSQIFGGLDICAIEVIKSINGKEYIIKINDCTMQLLKETQEEDCQSIAELIMHQMQIYCRPDQEISILTRIPSFDELPKLPQNNNLKIHQNGNIRQSSNTTDVRQKKKKNYFPFS